MATRVRDLSCFGDSFALGHGDRENCYLGWVGALGQEFNKANTPEVIELGPLPTFYSLAVLGDTAVKLSNRLASEWESRARSGRSRLSVVSIGCNDASICDNPESDRYREPVTNLELFRESVRRIMDTLTSNGDDAIYVGLTPYDDARTKRFRGRNQTFISERAREYEETALAASLECGAATVPLFERAVRDGFVDTMLDADGLHPCTEGHQWIFRQVLPVAEEMWS